MRVHLPDVPDACLMFRSAWCVPAWGLTGTTKPLSQSMTPSPNEHEPSPARDEACAVAHARQLRAAHAARQRRDLVVIQIVGDGHAAQVDLWEDELDEKGMGGEEEGMVGFLQGGWSAP